jgi:23S rRNA pseudouridine2605 synthase
VNHLSDDRIRLQKYMSECGVASRRKSEELIAKGAVKVNGTVAKIGDSVDPKRDIITLNGKKIENKTVAKYIMLHKPRGFVTTMSDELGRRCVASLVEDVGERVYPIGRLDRNSEGLLLLTNDGEFANAVMHPSKHVAKVYRVTIRPDISDEQIAAMSDGMMIDGRMTAPAQVTVLEKRDDRAVIEIVLFEGRNRQIRRMCEELGIEVARLKRTAIAGVKLGMLPQGKWRELTPQEVSHILSAAGAKSNKKEKRR